MTDEERLPDAQHERTTPFLLAGFERRVLPRLAGALPAWVVPDHLTVLGLLSSTWIGIAYILSNRNPAWLWGASLGLVIQWYGDSLDGTLARVRKIERPRYGYYLDHITDAYSTAAIGIGLGLSIVSKIVDAHAGEVWVEDNPGGGSVFVVRLPKRAR